MADRFFSYDFDPRFRWIWGPLGAKPDRDGVTISDQDDLLATFGRFRVETSVGNVKDAIKTGPYHWWKAIGVRASAIDSGITFGTTARGGVCILFHERIPNVFSVSRAAAHAGLTVTVAEPEALVKRLKPGR